MIVERRVMEIGDLPLAQGGRLNDVRLGYEAYGRLNAAGDNAVLICHPFPGNAHVAGRHAPDDALPGFWDALIGPGKAIDIEKFFVVAVDGLCNLNGRDGRTVAPGPDCRQGVDMALAFPKIAIRDLVESQRALLDKLGIGRLNAVAGPSMGSMQAFEWAVAHPGRVGRIVAALPVAIVDPYTSLMLHRWVRPIEAALGAGAGVDGLRVALVDAFAAVSVDAQGRGDLAGRFGDEPGRAITTVVAEASARANLCDPIAFLRLAEALRGFSLWHGHAAREGLDRLAAPVLLAPAATDELFPPSIAASIAAELRARGRNVGFFEIPGEGGHRDGVGPAAARMSAVLKAFIEAPP